MSIGRFNTTTLRAAPLTRVKIEQTRINATNDGEEGFLENVTSGECYKMPTTVRKFEPPETTTSQASISSEHRSGDPGGTFQPGPHDRDASITRSSTSAKPQDGVSESAAGFANKTLPAGTPCSERNDTTADAIRLRNMMAIVRFMMKLLRIVAEDAAACPARTQVGDTMIRAENVIVNGACREDRSEINAAKQRIVGDETATTSERTRQHPTSAEWRSAVAQRLRDGSSPSAESDTTESFSEALSRLDALKNDGLSKLLGTSTRRQAHATTVPSGTSSSSTTGFFLFYESVPRENTSVALTCAKEDSKVPVNKSEANSRGKNCRSNDNQRSDRRSPSRPCDGVQSVVDRLRLGKEEIISSVVVPERDNAKVASGSSEQQHPEERKSRGFRRSKSSDVVNNDVIGSALPERSRKSTKKVRGAVSDRGRATRAKLLNSFAREGASPADWSGERRVDEQQLPFEKKLQESRETPRGGGGGGGAAEKLVFRRVRGEINRPRDPHLAEGAGDSLEIEGRAVGERTDAGVVQLPIDAASSVNFAASDSRLADAIRCSPTSTPFASDSPRASSLRERISEEIANKHTRCVIERTGHSYARII